MAKGTYTYEPGNITTAGLDLMRFELGDTMVEGGADTCALTDEEISAALKKYPKKWKRAKLMLLEQSYVRDYPFSASAGIDRGNRSSGGRDNHRGRNPGRLKGMS